MKANEGKLNLRQMDVIHNLKLISCKEHGCVMRIYNFHFRQVDLMNFHTADIK